MATTTKSDAEPSLEKPCQYCFEEVTSGESLIQLTCGRDHEICADCLRQLWNSAAKDPLVPLPPSCCDTEVPFELLEPHISNEESEKMQKTLKERQSKNPVYCRHCSEFLDSAELLLAEQIHVYCPKCDHKTCFKCREFAHVGACKNDEAAAQLEVLIKDRKWQKCTNCPQIIERLEGCNHIVCICGSQWCHMCGIKWKQCNCPSYTAEMQAVDDFRWGFEPEILDFDREFQPETIDMDWGFELETVDLDWGFEPYTAEMQAEDEALRGSWPETFDFDWGLEPDTFNLGRGFEPDNEPSWGFEPANDDLGLGLDLDLQPIRVPGMSVTDPDPEQTQRINHWMTQFDDEWLAGTEEFEEQTLIQP